MSRASFVLAALWACADPPAPATTPPAETCDTDLTWAGFAGPLVITWCQPCHSADVPEEDRQGAPLDVNFDTAAEVLAMGDLVVAWAVGPDAPMPPGGGPTDEEREQLAEWIRCGTATGTVDPPVSDVCTPRVEVEGDARSSEWTCAGNVVVGDLVADAPSDCICEVTGSVIAETSVDLPELTWIGGDLEVLGPAETVDLPFLAEVAGSVRLEGNAALTAVELPRLETIGAALVIADNPAIEAIPSITSLLSVQDVTIRGNTALTTVDGIPRVEVLRSLEVADNPALTSLRSFNFVTEMDGDLVFRDNDALTQIDVVPDLERGATIRITGHERLQYVASFAFLTELTGSLELSANDALREVGHGTDGGGPFEALTSIDGSLVLDGNVALLSVGALHQVEQVGADLVVTNNPKLPQAEVDMLVWSIDTVDGSVVVSGNGP